MSASRIRLGLLAATGLAFAASAGCELRAPPAPVAPGRPCGGAVTPSGAATTISWRTTAPRADAPRLREWCTAVGPAVFDGERSGRSPSSSGSMAVVTWNVHVGGGDVAALVHDLRGGALTGGTPLTDFVLLLQEAHRSGPEVPDEVKGGAWTGRIRASPAHDTRSDIVDVARTLGLNVFYVPSMRNGGPGGRGAAEDRGNAILSTLPLRQPEAIELPYERQRRVAVAATVWTPVDGGDARVLRVVSAHLENGSRWSRVLDSFGASRTRQARALVGVIDQTPAVLGADLNTWSLGALERARRVLRAGFPSTPAGPVEATFTAGILQRRLDHLFLRLPPDQGASVRRVERRFGSDHHPVLALVRFLGERAAAAASAPEG